MPRNHIAALEAADRKLQETELYVEHIHIVSSEYKGQAVRYAHEASQLRATLKELRFNVRVCKFCDRNQYITDKLFNIPIL